MKKYLSILFTAIFAAMFVFSATSCSKDESLEDSIIGTWKLVSADALGQNVSLSEETIYFQFRKNGTFVGGNGTIAFEMGTWNLSGTTLIINMRDTDIDTDIDLDDFDFFEDVDISTIYLSKNKLTMSYLGGLGNLNFERVSDKKIGKLQ